MRTFTYLSMILVGITIMACSKSDDLELSEPLSAVKARGELPAPILQLNTSQVTENAGFSPRREHTSLVFDDKLWVLGGVGSQGDTGESWSSSDGIRWTKKSEGSGGFLRKGTIPARSEHVSAVFGHKIWVLGGTNKYASDHWGYSREDIRTSGNGSFWQYQNSLPGSGRIGATATIFAHKLWVHGGHYEDAWGMFVYDHYSIQYTEDGISWETIPESNFPVRHDHASVVFQGKIWVIGGQKYGGVPDNGYHQIALNDVWNSSDGIHWDLVNSPQRDKFSPRYDHTVVVYKNKLWVIGGGDDTGTINNDVWYSDDGIIWTKAIVPNDFLPRKGHTTVVFDDKIWIIGGVTPGQFKNDVMTLEIAE